MSTQQFSDADRLGGRPKGDPVLEAIDEATWSYGYGVDLAAGGYNVSDMHNDVIRILRTVYLQHHPQGPEVSGRTTNYYACRNCGEPIDMTGTGLEGLSAPGDGEKFERAIAILYPDGDYHGAIHRITTAHNADRAADKRRIAELEEQLAEWETRLSSVMPEDFKDWHQNSKKEWPAVAAWMIENQRKHIDDFWSPRVSELEVQIAELREDLEDALRDVINYAPECTSSKDYAEKRLSELEPTPALPESSDDMIAGDGD